MPTGRAIQEDNATYNVPTEPTRCETITRKLYLTTNKTDLPHCIFKTSQHCDVVDNTRSCHAALQCLFLRFVELDLYIENLADDVLDRLRLVGLVVFHHCIDL